MKFKDINPNDISINTSSFSNSFCSNTNIYGNQVNETYCQLFSTNTIYGQNQSPPKKVTLLRDNFKGKMFVT